MVEVFKTNVTTRDHANMLICHIRATFGNYKATFDLEDCDKILRVESSGPIHCSQLINFLREFGFTAEVLPDEIPLTNKRLFLNTNMPV